MQKEKFFPGEIIVIQAESLNDVFVQLNGIGLASRLSSGGRDIVYTVFPNGFMGLEALVGMRAWYTYEALTEVEALRFTVSEFEDLMKKQPKIFANIRRFTRTTFSEYAMRRIGDVENLLKFLWVRTRRYGVKLSLSDAEILVTKSLDSDLLKKHSLTVDEEGYLVESPTDTRDDGSDEDGGEKGDVDGDIRHS